MSRVGMMYSEKLEEIARLRAEVARLRELLWALCQGWKNGDFSEQEYLAAWDASCPKSEQRKGKSNADG